MVADPHDEWRYVLDERTGEVYRLWAPAEVRAPPPEPAPRKPAPVCSLRDILEHYLGDEPQQDDPEDIRRVLAWLDETAPRPAPPIRYSLAGPANPTT